MACPASTPETSRVFISGRATSNCRPRIAGVSRNSDVVGSDERLLLAKAPATGTAPICDYGFFGCGVGVVAGGWALGAVLDCGCAGTGVTGAGFAGAAAGMENFSRIELPCPVALSVRRTRAMAQIMNITAHQVVACERSVAAPRGPKAVWLPAPPKAPARSAALP